jgi:hypothetical protein
MVVSPRNGQVLLTEERSNNRVKRTSSGKRLDMGKDEIENRTDKIKAKEAWAVSSPSEKAALMQKGLKEHLEHSARNHTQSPNKGIINTNILKKELLEKAKQALAASSKVNVGLNVKKIQETLNKH